MSSSWRFWLISVAALTAISAATVIGFSHWTVARQSASTADRLMLLAELRRGAVEQYLATASAELKFWSTSPQILEVYSRLVATWRSEVASASSQRKSYIHDNPFPLGERAQLSSAGESAYDELHKSLHGMARKFVSERGYYDFFLISNDGDIVYTVEKEDDFATNLLTGAYKGTGLAEVFRKAVESSGEVVFSDLERYAPSDGAPALFMAITLRSEDTSSAIDGVLALQLPTDKLLDIMNYTSGMGRSGETFLVGEDHLMRSNSRFLEVSTVLEQRVLSPTVTAALAGGEGVELISDYRGVPVMSAYTSIEVGEYRWALLAEMDVEEITDNAALPLSSVAGLLTLFYSLGLWSLWYLRIKDTSEPSLAGDMLDSFSEDMSLEQ